MPWTPTWVNEKRYSNARVNSIMYFYYRVYNRASCLLDCLVSYERVHRCLVHLLRTSLKTTLIFVKELPFFKNNYKRGARLHRQLITRGPCFHTAGDFDVRCCCVFFARLSLKGETASKRTQAFTLSKENDQTNNLPGCMVILLDYQLHVTVDSFHYLKTFRRSDL